jgi:hypothetical protein
MTTTYATDAQVYARAPLVGKGLERVNVELVAASQSATTLDAYRVEAKRQMLEGLLARGITEADIGNPTALQDPEACLTAALVFEAAAIRDDAAQGQVDVFAGQAKRWRAAYEKAIASASPVATDVRPEGSSFTWERG